MKTIVVIPSYWGRPSAEPFDAADVVYDHPTPLDMDGTLARALDSFSVSDTDDFEILVLAAATNHILEKGVEDRVKSIVSERDWKVPVTVLSHGWFNRVREKVSGADEDAASLISLYGYSNVRNMCLLAGEAKAADVVVLFDDDEIAEDPGYMKKCTENIGKKAGTATIKGVAGWYKRPEGSYLCPPTCDWWWMEWRGGEAMNAAFRKFIGTKPRLKPTPFAFGGNMVIHKDIFTKVPFDPKVTRGEDIDYLFNARAAGDYFYMDNDLWIQHLPPKSRVPDWLGFRQNVLRFTYTRQKLKSQVEVDGMRIVNVEELDPYPGLFMRDDLDRKIFNTSSMLGLHYMLEKDDAGYQESMLNIELAERLIEEEKNAFRDYLTLRDTWIDLMGAIESLRKSGDLLVE